MDTNQITAGLADLTAKKQSANLPDATRLKQQWLAAWDRDDWKSSEQPQNHQRDKVKAAPVKSDSDWATADRVFPSAEQALVTTLPQSAGVAIPGVQFRTPVPSLDLVAAAVAVSKPPESAAVGLEIQLVSTRATGSTPRQPEIWSRILQQSTGEAFLPRNVSLSFRGDAVTIWVRDYATGSPDRFNSQLESLRRHLNKLGYRIQRLMVNGHEWLGANPQMVQKENVGTVK